MGLILLKNGLPASDDFLLEKRKANTEGKGRAVGISPWSEYAVHGRAIGGAAKKSGSWKDYYNMYKGHAILRAAIDKIAKSATNVGFDFVPRDKMNPVDPDEVQRLKAFFSNQPDFIGVLSEIYRDLYIYGDAYLYIIPDRRRNPTRLKRLHPKTMHIKVRDNGQVEAYYQKDLDDPAGSPVIRFEEHEIIHFKIGDPDNDIYGLSPLESLRWAVTADMHAQRYNAAFFLNAGITGTIIGIHNANPDEVERNKQWLEDHYTGPEGAHKPIIIEGENITISKAVATHNEMGFLEGRRFIIMEILAVLDVPPAKLGMMETANRSNAKEQDKTFRTESISPMQRMVENVLNDRFIRPILGIEDTIFTHSDGDARDAIEQMDYYSKGLEKGIYNVNEVRAIFGMPPVDGGDVNGIQTPVGFIPLDRLDLFFSMPQPNSDKVPGSTRDPATGEAMPRSSVRRATGTSPVMAKTYDDTQHYVTGALLHLNDALHDDLALKQAYAYANDAADEDARFRGAAHALRKAVEAVDDYLREGYITRAASVFQTTLMGEAYAH